MSHYAFSLLLVLMACHWAADYTHLSRPNMLAAKRLGKPLAPIFEHASVHGLLFAITLTLFGMSFAKVWYLVLIEVFTHFLIDVWKGRMNGWYPALTSPANVYHWWVFGFDQFLHHAVIVLIVFLSA